MIRAAAALVLATAGLALPPRGQSAATPLAWEQRVGHRVARLTVPAMGRAGFTLLTPAETGIHFTNQISYEHSLTNRVLLDWSAY